MVDLLLISPPVANLGQATPGISVLTAFLRAKGWDVRQWDLAIDAFHHFHDAGHLAGCLRELEARGCDDALAEIGRRAVAEIGWAKDALRRPGVEHDPETMRRAFAIIDDAGLLLTAVGARSWVHDSRVFLVPDAFRSFADLDAATTDGSPNPYVAYLEDVAIARVLGERPEAVGVSITYLSQLLPGVTLVRKLRQRFPELPIVVGGAYLTSLGEEVERIPRSVLPVDAVVLHDGEAALDDWLARTLRDAGGGVASQNLLLPSGAGFERARPGPFAHTDLDDLPVPSWTADGLELDRYLVPRYPIPLPLSRGCYWGRCAYCNISSQTASSYRVRRTDLAIADIRAAMTETGSSWFDLPTDSFRPRDAHALALAILEEGLEVEWGAEVLLDAGFSDDVLGVMARSGCRCLRFGLESACEDTLRAMRKPNRPREALRILTTCRAVGIRTAVMLIVGFPTETQAQLNETYDYLLEHAGVIDFVALHPFSLVRGSEMARDPGAHGLFVLPDESVLTPSVEFGSANAVGMRTEDLPRVVHAMREGLRASYPDIDEKWTVGIGGWMTFPSCCGPRPDATRTAAADLE